jgi:NAD-dependent deacetylase
MAEVAPRIDAGSGLPDCPGCHGTLLKPAAVFFGEALPRDVLLEASSRARSCDLMLVIGSTLVVYPAAYMPAYAREAGARLIIINLSDTPMDRHATVLIRERAGAAMTAIMERLRPLMGR